MQCATSPLIPPPSSLPLIPPSSSLPPHPSLLIPPVSSLPPHPSLLIPPPSFLPPHPSPLIPNSLTSSVNLPPKLTLSCLRKKTNCLLCVASPSGSETRKESCNVFYYTLSPSSSAKICMVCSITNFSHQDSR